MKLYLASVYTSSIHMVQQIQFGQPKFSTAYRRMSEVSKKHRQSITNILESYHYTHKGRQLEFMEHDFEVFGPRPFFLDSGAFSMFSQGAHVDIDKYIKYCKDNEHLLDMVSVLDVFNGKDRRENAKLTWLNQTYMERNGVYPLPCYHFGEPYEVLEYYAKNYPYITIGGMVPIPNDKLEPWLDEVWGRFLTDEEGYPVTKVHGFGLTSPNLMNKYPWYSVDSSSWVQISGTGNVYLPQIKSTVSLSVKSPNHKNYNQHTNSLKPLDIESVNKYVEELGYTVEMLKDSYVERWVFCMKAYQMLGEQHDTVRFAHENRQRTIYDAA